jgi:hypothetical protein
MSLMKLLSVSTSFVSGKNQAGRYKMTEQGVLPKFAPVGRPVSLAPKAKAHEPLLAAEVVATKFDCAKSAGKPENATSLFALRQSPNAGSSMVRPSADIFAASPEAIVCVNSVPTSTNFFRLQKNPFATASTEKAELMAPVQPELYLDAVKVVRNELNDADFDVVPAKPQIKTENIRPPRRRFFKPELAGLAWSRFTARFFNSERVRV